MDKPSDGNKSGEGANIKVVAKPGKFPVRINVMQNRNADSFNTFQVDFAGYDDVVTNFAVLAGDYESRGTLEAEDLDLQAYEEKVFRMGQFTLAKKLASSVDAEDSLIYDRELKTIYSSKIYSTTGLISLADGYGHVDTPEQGKWKMEGQAFHAVDRYIKAVERSSPEFDRHAHFCVNLAMPNALEGARSVHLGRINGFAETVGEVLMPYGTATMMGIPPKVTKQGANIHRILMTNVQKPPYVMKAYQICIVIDEVLERNPQGIPNEQERQALVEAGIWMVNWNRDAKALKEAEYAREVQLKLNRTMSKATNWVEVTRMKPQGEMWQLIRRLNTTHSSSPVSIVGPGLDYGTMLGGNGTSVLSVLRYDLIAEERQASRAAAYAQGMMRSGKG